MTHRQADAFFRALKLQTRVMGVFFAFFAVIGLLGLWLEIGRPGTTLAVGSGDWVGGLGLCSLFLVIGVLGITGVLGRFYEYMGRLQLDLDPDQEDEEGVSDPASATPPSIDNPPAPH